ncbi:MAG: hypothetical protein DRP08_02215 [Candidatus Aenigmatarchaeota archaeon]|nr:MAG: hypothetical protein DRP08_02215 [Candidatus Aenigmarchaeota archaeon]
MMVILAIEGLPPTINHYWGVRGKRRFVKKEGKEWKKKVWATAKNKKIEKFDKDKKIVMSIFFLSPRNFGDLDNRLKPLLDSLEGVLFENDKQIRKFEVVEAKKAQKDFTIITLRELHEID